MKISKLVVGAIVFLVSFSVSANESGLLNQLPMLKLKVNHSAGYPFVCYRGSVEADLGREFIEGEITKIYYGYTRATRQEFEQDPNQPWFNSRGESEAQGVIDVEYIHDRGYKGNMLFSDVYVPVVPGMNLVFRVGYLKKVGGSCYDSTQPLKFEYTESDVFFMDGQSAEW